MSNVFVVFYQYFQYRFRYLKWKEGIQKLVCAVTIAMFVVETRVDCDTAMMMKRTR